MTSWIFEIRGSVTSGFGPDRAPSEENMVHFHSSPLAKFGNGKSAIKAGYLNTDSTLLGASLGSNLNIHLGNRKLGNHGR